MRLLFTPFLLTLVFFLFSLRPVFSQSPTEPLAASPSNPQTSLPTRQDKALKKLSQRKQSLRFSKNVGQMDQSVLYHVNDLQADHYFLGNEIRTVLKHTESRPSNAIEKSKGAARKSKINGQQDESLADGQGEAVQTLYAYSLNFLGTAGPQQMLDLRPDIVKSVGQKNYIKGAKRFTNIPQYGQIQYKSLWEGIDVDFYENKAQLKYDFVVAPFADPTLIQFSMQGVDQLRVDEQTGELSFITPFGELRKGAPYTYQIIEGKRIEITSTYQIKEGVISFKLGSYDQSVPLVIDPIALKFATFLGGNDRDEIYDIYVHPSSKKIYLTGITRSSAFPGVVGTAVSSATNDGFITCMSKDGSSVLWTTIIGGDEGYEYLYKIHVSDDEDDIFVTGHTSSDDYPTDGLLAPFSAELAGSSNPIISRLNGDGTILKYSTYFPVTSYALERYTVIGDLVYGATYYDDSDANNYPINMPAGAYISIPPNDSMADEGQIIFAINTALAGDSSFQYGTFWYDTTAGSYSYLEFSDSDQDGDGNIYFGGYMSIGEPGFGPENLFPAGGIQTVDQLQSTLGPDGENSTVGWVAQFDPTLSNLIYATPYVPVAHKEYMEVCHYSYFFNMEVNDSGDIYVSHSDALYNLTNFNDLVIAPTAKINHLQAFKLESSGDDLLLNISAKIAVTDRSQFEYIVTAAGDWSYPQSSAGAKLDSRGRLHWLFSKNQADVALDALATDGTLQKKAISQDQTQYVILSPAGDLAYATVLGANVDFSGSKMDQYAHASFVGADGTFYAAGSIETDAQKTFPVTTSYWDPETATQVFVYDATPTSDTEGWLAVFHEPAPTTNVISDFAVGNDTFCVNGLIYQDPNYGPILGDPISFQSGDGSIADHVLPDIRPGAFTEAHPDPSGGDALHWEISRDNGASWTPLPSSNAEIYKPESESVAGSVQYRRVYTYGPAATPFYSNIASATISGSLGLDLQSPTDAIYFCPGTIEDFTFPITGATGNIDWQWFDGFAPLDNSLINPATGSDIAANFQATIPAGVSKGAYHRLVVEDETGCVAERFVTTAPLSDEAGSSTTLAICPGDINDEVTIGPSTPNPDFEYSWSGPSGFSSSLPNPTVSVDGTYSLQVRRIGDPSFCVGGETSVAILPTSAHDTVLVDTTINLSFCQSDIPTPIGLAGPAPSGYLFQWSPAINLDDPTLYNPTFYPGTMPFGPPSSDIEYRFTAIRVSDGCVFEDTIYTSTTALAKASAGQDRNAVCSDSFIVGNSGTTGDYFAWRAIETSFPAGLAALISDPDFFIDDVPTNLGTNKFAEIKFPVLDSVPYTIDFELQSSYAPLSNACFAADTIRLSIFPCVGGSQSFCPEIATSKSQGSGGVCDLPANVLSVNEFAGGTYEWTTYAVDGVLQSAGTPPRGLFDTDGNPLSASGPHPTELNTDLDNGSWGWAGAFSVEYQVNMTLLVDDSLQSCTDRIIVYSAVVGTPVVDINEMDVCLANAPGTLLTGTGKNLPYQINGSDYNAAPNTLLRWAWEGGPINSDADTPYPTIEPTASTLYTVIVTDTLTGCFTIDTFQVTLHTVEANAGPDLATACTGAVVQIGSSARSGMSYQWTPASGLNFPIGTANSSVARPYLTIPGTPTTYSLVATQTATGCQATDTVLITPETNAPAPPTAATYNSCPDGELVLGPLYSPSAGISFSWTAGAGANLAWLDNTSINQPTVSLPSNFTGPATFTLSVSNGTCGSASTDYTISNQVADVELGADITAVCTTPYIQIGSATQTVGYDYVWSPTDGLFTDAAGTIPYTSQDVNTVYAKPSRDTEYTLIASNPTTACLFLDKITVNAPAGIDVNAGPDQTLCPDQSSITIGQSGSGTISWNATGYDSDPTNAATTPSSADSTTMMSYLSSLNSTTTNFSQTTFAAGVYQYQVTADYGGGCIATDELIVIVSDLPNGLAGSSKTLCNGETLELGTTPQSGVSYQWAILNPTAGSGTLSDSRSPNPTINPTETTSYSLSYTDINTGCKLTEIVTVSVIASPEIADAAIGPLCDPIAAQDLSSQIPNYGTLATATWYIDYEGGPIEATPTAVQPARTTEYFLLAANTDGCTDLAKVSLNIESPQAPSVLPSADVDCNTGVLDLADYQGSPSDPSYSLSWHGGNDSAPSSALSSTIVGKGTYYIFETGPSGCVSSSDSIVITDASCPTPFPVEWLEFTVKQENTDAQISWSTAAETNTDYFIVERSVDGILFMPLSSIKAQGSSTEVNQYQLTDEKVTQMGHTTLFYRIRQVDLDAKIDYSNIVQLNLSGIENMLSWINASPIPADRLLSVKYQLINTPSAKLEIVNTLGAKIYSQNIMDASSQIDIDVHALPSGYYYLSLEGENGKSVVKFQVMH